MSVETTTTKRRKKSIKNANKIEFRVINLHKYDLRDVTSVIFTTKSGVTFSANFVAEPTDEKDMTANKALYIEMVEEKPYYNTYKVLYYNTEYTTSDLELATFVQKVGQDNPNYLYEF
jgi:hypothetical protein